jgi:hypothetical protein
MIMISNLTKKLLMIQPEEKIKEMNLTLLFPPIRTKGQQHPPLPGKRKMKLFCKLKSEFGRLTGIKSNFCICNLSVLYLMI